MSSPAVLRGVDAFTVPIPDLDQALQFYRDQFSRAPADQPSVRLGSGRCDVTEPQEYARLSVWRALGGSVDAAGFGIRQAWRWTPGCCCDLC